MNSSDFSAQLPLWSMIPFLLMLMFIAVCPLWFGRFWESNRNKFLVSLILGLPVGVAFVFVSPGFLLHTGAEYFSFIVLLAALFIISSGIVLRGDLRATPLINTLFLAVGSVLASFMGTTGAAILLLRALLKTNSERRHVWHTVVFFTFLVGNIGGLLTPLGDPPLFMGYLKGVPFTWTFRLFWHWLFMVSVVLMVYFCWDTIQYRKESMRSLKADLTQRVALSLSGHRLNLPLLLGVMCAVALIHASPWRELILIVLALASYRWTPKTLHQENRFTWSPMIEVAVLFFGIFITMIPALIILQQRGSELGVVLPWHFFWATGILSSFLDNTPTYVAFLAIGQSLGQAREIIGMPDSILAAISVGAVFMGANTYIGNAPNFMIKAIAEERGVRMPSFFGYSLIALCVLIPLFVVATFVFFI